MELQFLKLGAVNWVIFLGYVLDLWDWGLWAKISEGILFIGNGVIDSV